MWWTEMTKGEWAVYDLDYALGACIAMTNDPQLERHCSATSKFQCDKCCTMIPITFLGVSYNAPSALNTVLISILLCFVFWQNMGYSSLLLI